MRKSFSKDIDKSGQEAKRLMTHYRALPQHERMIMQVLSVIYLPVNQTTFKKVLDAILTKNLSGFPSSNIIGKNLQERLVRKNLISFKNNAWICNSEIENLITHETLNGNTFQIMSYAVEKILPLNRDYSGQFHKKEHRQLRFALYRGDYTRVITILGMSKHLHQPLTLSRAKQLIQFCTESLHSNWFARLPIFIKFLVIMPLLENKAVILEDISSLGYLVQSWGQESSQKDISITYVESMHGLLKGNPDDVEHLLINTVSKYGLLLKGWMRFLQGKYDNSLRCFESAEAVCKHEDGTYKISITGFPLIFYFLALMHAGEIEWLKQIVNQVILARDNELWVGNVAEIFAIGIKGIQNHGKRCEINGLQHNHYRDSPICNLFRCFMLCWLGQTPNLNLRRILFQNSMNAHRNGLLWYARESALLLEVFGSNDDCQRIIYDTKRTTSFHNITKLLDNHDENRLIFHLKPLRKGFKFECYLQPFGQFGPLFHPGQVESIRVNMTIDKLKQRNRCFETEERYANTIVKKCKYLHPKTSWTWDLRSIDKSLETILQLKSLENYVVLKWPEGKSFQLTNISKLDQIKISIRKHSDWFALSGELELDNGRMLTLKQLLNLYQENPARFVALESGDFLTLTNELRARLDGICAFTDGDKLHSLTIASIHNLTEGMDVKCDKYWKNKLNLIEQAKNLCPKVPDTLNAVLRDYQLDGFRWLYRLSSWGAGACLADDMGLGKTIQTLALILSRAANGPTLVLAPASVCLNWMDEANQFAPILETMKLGEGNRKKMLEVAGPYSLIICSYGLLQSESDLIATVSWNTIVADEAQAIKNVLSKRSKAAISLNGKFRMIVTGTPIENHLGELWNLFNFINPGLLGSQQAFNEKYVIPIESNQHHEASHRLKKLIAPFILRRLKTNVVQELPSRTDITLHVELNKGEAELYEALRRQTLEKVSNCNDKPGKTRVKILAEIIRLRMACCHPKLIMADTTIGSAKMVMLGEIVKELIENKHKALIFSQFLGHLGLIREYLGNRKYRYQYLDGSTPPKLRKAAIDAFQSGDGDLFLISLRAGGAGLNLTAADYVIHMDPWWNPAVEDQASDRVHRIGQERPVTIYRLIAKNTIEEKIMNLHRQKRDLADGLLVGGDMSGRLSLEELWNLIEQT